MNPTDCDLFDITLLEDCEHLYCNDGYCETCGTIMGPKIDYEINYNEGISKSKNGSNFNYENEIDKIEGTSDDFKKALLDKLNTGHTDNRQSNKSFNFFCAAYVTGVEMGEIKPDVVAGKLEMKSKTVNKSLRAISGTGFKTFKDNNGKVLVIPVVSISPIDIVEEICNEVDKDKLGPHIDKIKKIISDVIKVNATVLNDKPRYVAAGFIKFYCQKEGISIKDIGIKALISNPTLNQYSAKAMKLYGLYYNKTK